MNSQNNSVQITMVMKSKFISPNQSFLKWEKVIFDIP
jgi:hypothetical protein